MEIQEVPNEEFKIIVLQMPREIKENRYNQFNYIRKPMQEKIE